MSNYCKCNGLRYAEAVLACLNLIWDEDEIAPFVQPAAINIKQNGYMLSEMTEDRHAWVVNHGSADDIVIYLQGHGEYILHQYPNDLPRMPDPKRRETVFYCSPDRASEAAVAIRDYLTKGILPPNSQAF